MVLTRFQVAARAFTNRPRVGIDKLSEDVLLEIFNAYRQLYESDPRYENIWNSRDGWFKLTHVCRHWRRLVHSAPSLLHVHLLFTPRRSSKAMMLRNLPPFPILVDYYLEERNKKELTLALAAIKRSSGVRGISLRIKQFMRTTAISKALSRPFPKLESLELEFAMTHPATFLLGPAPCLRRLKLWHVEPMYLSPLLSTSTSLVELSLILSVQYDTLPEESFVANLRRMPYLRRLELRLSYSLLYDTTIGDSPRPAVRIGDVVSLPNLMQLVLAGHHTYLEALVAVLAAPSLRHLDAEFTEEEETYAPQLCKFICNTDNQFRLVSLDFSDDDINDFQFIAATSVHAPPLRIFIPALTSLEEFGNSLSGPLATVERLVIRWLFTDGTPDVQWRGFFNHIRQLKILQVPWEVAHHVAHSFQQDGQEPAMELFPALEEIKMDMTHPTPRGRNNQDRATVYDAFEPLIAARKKVGCSIKLSLTSRCACTRRWDCTHFGAPLFMKKKAGDSFFTDIE